MIAVRGLVSGDAAGRFGATPFYLQQSLGGSETLRGYSTYRFQDQALVHASVEYRLRLHRFIELAPFLDAGTVASRLSRVSLDAVKITPGIGVRARTSTRMLFRLDWAHGSEGHRVIFGTGPIF